jgi:hypothetical protein
MKSRVICAPQGAEQRLIFAAELITVWPDEHSQYRANPK